VGKRKTYKERERGSMALFILEVHGSGRKEEKGEAPCNTRWKGGIEDHQMMMHSLIFRGRGRG